MKILIYTTHRTGSTSLAQLLMSHYDCDYQREGFYKNKNFLKIINNTENIIIKLTPSEVDYNSVRNVFDKCIILTRNDIKAQAESRLYAENIKKYFTPYTIDDLFLKNYSNEIYNMEEIIKNENKILNKTEDCLHVTYEELYFSTNGIIEIENYLGTKFSFKIDGKKKYRNSKKTLI